MTEVPIQWLQNNHALENPKSELTAELFPPGLPQRVRRLHSEIPGYRMSPLKSLPHLARRIGVGGIWVKDESARLSLNSFKVLGGAYAIYKKLLERGGFSDQELTLRDLLQLEGDKREKLGHPTFATATDGNHGTGVAWAASKMGFPSVIYVHSLTTKDRIRGIQRKGGRVVVVDGNYDDAVRQVSIDAEKNGWEVISDTSWEGYQDVPKWIMQGYATMFVEAQEQFAAQGIRRCSRKDIVFRVGGHIELGVLPNLCFDGIAHASLRRLDAAQGVCASRSRGRGQAFNGRAFQDGQLATDDPFAAAMCGIVSGVMRITHSLSSIRSRGCSPEQPLLTNVYRSVTLSAAAPLRPPAEPTCHPRAGMPGNPPDRSGRTARSGV